MNLDLLFGKLTVLEPHDAPQAYQFVRNAIKNHNIPQNIVLLQAQNSSPGAWSVPVTHLKNMKVKTPTYGVVLTDGIIKMLNEGQKITNHLSTELAAVVGHEMSHAKDGIQHMLGIRYAPALALPVAFAAGYYLLDKTLRKPGPCTTVKEKLSALNETIKDEKKAMLAETDSLATVACDKEKLTETWLRVGGTVAAAAIGLAAGLGVTRHLMIATEHRADKFAAELIGDAKPVQSMLRKLHKEFFKPISYTVTVPMHNTSSNASEMIGRLQTRMRDYAQQELKHLVLEFFNAHPPLNQRIKKLDALSFTERVAESAKAAASHVSL